MVAMPLAHIGHWYHALLYLAPVFVLVIVFAIQGRRDRLAEEREEREAREEPPPEP
jgi:cytochrome c-type biogenesis protein CcmH/NrfF